jgi:putative nucleotidyltransferase with HDIG domain
LNGNKRIAKLKNKLLHRLFSFTAALCVVLHRRPETRTMIPSVETCFQLMDKYRMLDNIRAHSIVVATISHILATALSNVGILVSIPKVVAGALMHDIGKTEALQSGEDHTAIGRRICLSNELDEIVDIVEEHVRLKSYDSNGTCSEKEIVYYADKRVNHDKVVTLEERLDYILERYGGGQESLHRRIRKNFEFCKQMEGKLFSQLDFRPHALPQLVRDNRTLFSNTPSQRR